jgi:heme-degrading monooxygenase HmoA
MNHVRLAVFTITMGTPAEIAEKAKAGMLPIFREQPGFVRYRLLEVDPDTMMSVSEWTTADAATAATEQSAAWVTSNLGQNVTIIRNDVGDESLLDDVIGEALFDESA